MKRRFFPKKAVAKKTTTAAAAAIPKGGADFLTPEYKTRVLENSVLGTRGFTIPKAVLCEEDLTELKRDLSVKKIAPMGAAAAASSGMAADDTVLFMYRENDKKIYIPRYYAEKRYGAARNTKIPAGEEMETVFKGSVRDYQEVIINTYMDHVRARCDSGAVGGGGLLSVPCGAGKTVMAIKIATDLRKKTLIIVHKEFLMNQWIERIHDFCTGARVGKIQGDVFDVEGKDFVIGMLQTLYMRPFPEDAFHSFGLLVIDETHRICSEQFSKALFKINPRYTLGISATIERKDGLESVLNMFVGDILYHKDRDGDDPVCVRAVEYVSADEEFNKVEYDFRGNVKYSTMISKLCETNARTEFVIRLVRDLLEENSEQQIMVIAHNKSVLHYIHDAIHERGIATVGYYVGGMRERDLKATEEKTVVIATYSMAAEALDIKTLSTLVMVTPKTDIIQTVGRILRMKHQQPIVVDVVDTHDVFQNQWRQRRAFYKKCNYRIRHIKSPNYAGMNFNWDEDRTWRRVFEPVAKGCAASIAESVGTAAAAAAAADSDDEAPATASAGATAGAKKCLINIAALKVIPDHIL